MSDHTDRFTQLIKIYPDYIEFKYWLDKLPKHFDFRTNTSATLYEMVKRRIIRSYVEDRKGRTTSHNILKERENFTRRIIEDLYKRFVIEKTLEPVEEATGVTLTF